MTAYSGASGRRNSPAAMSSVPRPPTVSRPFGAVPRPSAAYAAKIPVAATAATMNYSSSPSCLIEASALTLMNVCEPSATVRSASPFVPSVK